MIKQKKTKGKLAAEEIFSDSPSVSTLTDLLDMLSGVGAEKEAPDVFLRSLTLGMALLNNTHDIVWRYDADLKCLFASPSTFETLGYKPDEFKKLSFEEFLGAAVKDKIKALYKTQSKNQAEIFTVEKFFEGRDGRRVWLETTLAPVARKGRLIGVIGVSRNTTWQKIAEEVQKHNEESLRGFIDHLNDMVCEVDENGVFIYANQKFLDALGYEPEDIKDKKLSALIHPEDVDQTGKQRNERLTALRESEDVLRFRSKSGEWRWLECRSSLYKNAGGAVRSLMISSDVTERIKSEEVIVNERNLLLALINTMPESIFFKNTKGEFLLANKHVANLMGVSDPEELKGKTDFDFYPERLAKIFFEDEQKIIETGKPILNKEEIVKDDQEEVFYLTTKAPVRNSEGKIIGIIGIGMDVTDRKKAQEKQLESERKYRFLYENAPIGIFRSTSAGKLVDANPAAAKILGYRTVEELLSSAENLAETVYVDAHRRRQFVEEVRKKGEVENFEIEAYKKDNELIWISLNARISQLLEGEAFMIEGFISDITGRKKSEAQILDQNKELTELNATKDKFFSIIAHDLRNPFNGLQALSELLIKNLKEYDKGQILEVLNLINESAERGVRLLVNLLEWSRSQTGRMEYLPEYFSLRELVSDTVGLVKNQAAKKNIRLEVEVDPCFRLYADKNMISAVLRNLISNAIKFTFKEGQVRISANVQSPGMIRVCVSDNGMGIAKERQELLFKLGEHITTKGTANETGTGLGLILCKDFIERNRGRIWVESEYGKGSAFIFTAPAMEEAQ